ncbi:hypothetical protein GCM10027416_13780 [Okibacterium endophyticum]
MSLVLERTAADVSTALVAVSHGTSSLDGQRAVEALTDAVASLVPERRVTAGFVDVQHPDVPVTLGGLAADQPAVIVPVLLSAGYHVHVDLAEAAADAGRLARVSKALGPDDRLVRVLVRRLRAAGLRADDQVVLACAGSSDSRAVADCAETARRLSLRLGRDVRAGFISAVEPELSQAVRETRQEHPGARVIISAYLLAPGYFYDLAVAAGADAITQPLLTADGEPPHEIVSIVCDRFTEAREGHALS